MNIIYIIILLFSGCMKAITVDANGDLKESVLRWVEESQDVQTTNGYLNGASATIDYMQLSDADKVLIELPERAKESTSFHISLYYNTNSEMRGTIAGFGFATNPNWDDLVGMEVIVTASGFEPGEYYDWFGWFNIDSDGVTIPTGYRKTYNREFHCRRATFQLSKDELGNYRWLVKSLDKAEPEDNMLKSERWGNQYTIWRQDQTTGNAFLDSKIPKGVYLPFSEGYYYRIKLFARLSQSSSDNEQSVDLSGATFFSKFYTSMGFDAMTPNGGNKIRQRSNQVLNSGYWDISDEFILDIDENTTITWLLTHVDDDTLGNNVIEFNDELSYIKVDIKKIPKDEWHYQFVIPTQPIQPGNTFTIDLPGTSSPQNYIPFAGYYNVDVYVEVAELDAGMSPVNCGTSQTLTVGRSGGGAARTIDKSLVYVPAPGSSAKVMNYSLQGSAVIELNKDEKVRVVVTLPNGVNKTVQNGYVDLNFINKTAKLLKN